MDMLTICLPESELRDHFHGHNIALQAEGIAADDHCKEEEKLEGRHCNPVTLGT
jgi:hypothetical protein